MHPDGGGSHTEAPTAEGAPGGRVSFLDQALWKRLKDADTTEAFAAAWLALQCRMIDNVERGVVVLGAADTGPYSPAAYWPEGGSGSPGLSAAAEAAMAERRGVVQGHEPTDTTLIREGCFVAFPIMLGEALHGVVAVEIAGAVGPHLRTVMRQLQWGAIWIEYLIHRQQGDADRRVRTRTIAVLDLIATAAEEEGFTAACRAVVTELAQRLDCDRVSVGFMRHGHTRVVAISHSAHFGKRMNLVRMLGAAMDEAIEQRTIIIFPPGTEGEVQVTLAHENLALGHGAGAILTVPLYVKETFIGGLTLERPESLPFDQDAVEICDCVASVLGPILEEKRLNDRWLVVKAAAGLAAQLKRLTGPGYFGRKLAAAGALALFMFCYFAVGEYRINATSSIEGLVRRVVVAPFDGFIAAEHVRAGDLVKERDLLATLDDRDLALERLRWVTSRQQRMHEYDKALAERDRSQAKIVKVQIEQAEAQIALIDEQLTRAKIFAPFEALVVAGDLSQSIGAAVTRGEVLFELAPLDAYRVVIEVDESQISEVAVGQAGNLVVASMPDTSMPFTVEKITPVAEAREGRNFFRVEARLDEVSERLRPGMKGIAKIDVDERRLVWIWSRALINWLRIASWRWLP